MSHDPQQPQPGPQPPNQPYGQGQPPYPQTPGQPYDNQPDTGQPYQGQLHAPQTYPHQPYPPQLPAPKKPRPRALWWLGPALLFLGAVASVVVALAMLAGQVSQPRTEVPVDGSAYEVSTTAGAEYLVWNDAAVSFLRCSAADADGRPIAVRTPTGSWTVNQWEAVGQFTARGDAVTLTCEDDAAVGASTVRVSEAPEVKGFVASVVLLVLAPAILGGIGFVWALVLLILTLSRPSRRALTDAA